jgi:hypothetical protein
VQGIYADVTIGDTCDALRSWILTPYQAGKNKAQPFHWSCSADGWIVATFERMAASLVMGREGR